MSTRPVEVYPAMVTRAVLNAYAEYLLDRAKSAEGNEEEPVNPQSRAHAPASVEEALAPLEVLYGKTALSAIGIALHGVEPVVRFVEAAEEREDQEEEEVDVDEVTSDDEVAPTSPTAGYEPRRDDAAMKPKKEARSTANADEERELLQSEENKSSRLATPQQAQLRSRCLYHVGEHTLFSPYFCPCSAYAYQSIQRQEVWCCKHLLALQLALRVETTGLPQDNIRVRVVSSEEFALLLQRAL